jgi:hypothetical protein
VRRLDQKGRYPFIVVTTGDVESLLVNHHCATLKKHGVFFARVPPIPLPDWAKIMFPHWGISMNKISGMLVHH